MAEQNQDNRLSGSAGGGVLPKVGGDVESLGLWGAGGDGMPRTPSGVPGLDELLGGGLPEGRATLISGAAGSGKTLAAIHFAIDGAEQAGHGAVYVSFEEPADQLRKTMLSLGKDAETLEAENRLAVIDAVSPPPGMGDEADEAMLPEMVGQRFELAGLLARIDAAAKRVGAKRVALDSLAGLAGVFLEGVPSAVNVDQALRAPLARLIKALKARGYTLLMTAERDQGDNGMTRYGLEAFLADGVIVLRHKEFGERRRRTVEVCKLRSCAHAAGESPLLIGAGRGIVVLPLDEIKLTQAAEADRATSGLPELDRMTGGGLLRDSVVLVSGASGTGKSLLSLHFAVGGAENGERTLILAFEESREQLLRNAEAFGLELGEQAATGQVMIDCVYPESLSIEAHLLRIKQQIETHRPNRLVIDSLSALERIGPDFAFRQFLMSLAAMVKRMRVTTLLTASGGSFGDQVKISEQHISTLNDTIILLRYLDIQGRVERDLTVLKMRGSGHAREHRRYRITDEGMKLSGPRGDSSYNVAGERVDGLFSGEASTKVEEKRG